MTVSTTVSRVAYAGDGSTVTFAFPYYFLEPTDLVVIRRNADGTETTLTHGAEYTVANAGNPAGGTVTLTAAVAAGLALVIYRDPPILQPADYVAGGRFPAESHEKALDRLTMVSQRTRNMATRSLKLYDTDTNGSGSYNALGNRITNLGYPVSSGDAATKAYVDATNAGASIAEAQAAAQAADADAAAAAASAAAAAQSAIDAASASGLDLSPYLQKADNLAGLTNKGTARGHLSVYSVAEADGLLAGKANATHGHVIADVSGLQAALNGKAASAHSHVVADVTGLQGALDAKAPLNSPGFTGTPTVNGSPLGQPSTALGDIGTYALMLPNAATNPGATIAGSALRYSSGQGTQNTAITPGGTWRCMGYSPAVYDPVSATNVVQPSLFVRIA